jgi:hypothetical protein
MPSSPTEPPWPPLETPQQEAERWAEEQVAVEQRQRLLQKTAPAGSMPRQELGSGATSAE